MLKIVWLESHLLSARGQKIIFFCQKLKKSIFQLNLRECHKIVFRREKALNLKWTRKKIYHNEILPGQKYLLEDAETEDL